MRLFPSTLPTLLLTLLSVHAAGALYKIDYPASPNTNELQTPVTYTLWLPDNVKTIRAIIVHQHGAGTTASIEGSTAALDLHWQALAKKWDCALWSSSYHVTTEKNDLSPGGSELWFHPGHGSEKAFLKGLEDFAAKSNHPEIAKIPWVLWGHSGGGIWSDVMATLHPARVLAMFLRSGTAAMFRTHDEFIQPTVPPAEYLIPTMINTGVKEKGQYKPADHPDQPGREHGPWFGNLATFREWRSHGALVTFAPDPRTGHECGDSRYLAIPFLDACLAARLPEKGAKDQKLKPMPTQNAWLAPLLGDEAKPAAKYEGNPNEANWLPNEKIARLWSEYVKTGSTSDTTPPPAPTNVQLKPTTEATELTWDCEADFESGLQQFIILRDGQEIAKVPEKPIGKFGRPLFQSMTYHDTPAQPVAEMRYKIDTAEKHKYQVVSVNSVGLQSKPSSTAKYTP